MRTNGAVIRRAAFREGIRHGSLVGTVTMLLTIAGCTDDGATEPAIDPAMPLLNGQVAEPRIAARLEPFFANDGGRFRSYRMRVTSNLSETVSGGACATAVDAKPFTSGEWVNATSAEIACPDILLSFMPGVENTVFAYADPAVLRRVGRLSAGRVIVRARHVVGNGSTSFVAQSAEHQIVAP